MERLVVKNKRPKKKNPSINYEEIGLRAQTNDTIMIPASSIVRLTLITTHQHVAVIM